MASLFLFRQFNKTKCCLNKGLKLLSTSAAYPNPIHGAPCSPPPPKLFPLTYLSPAAGILAAGGFKSHPQSMHEIKEQHKKDSKEDKYYCIYCEVLHSSAEAVLEHDCSKLSSKQKKSFTNIHEPCGNRFKHPHALDEHSKHCDGFGCHEEYKRGQIVEGKLVQGFPASQYKRKGDFSGKEILYLTDFKN